MKGNLILNDSFLSLGAAIDGVGIAYTMEIAIENEVKAGKLEVVLGQYAATLLSEEVASAAEVASVY